jgi:hypothetical protein
LQEGAELVTRGSFAILRPGREAFRLELRLQAPVAFTTMVRNLNIRKRRLGRCGPGRRRSGARQIHTASEPRTSAIAMGASAGRRQAEASRARRGRTTRETSAGRRPLPGTSTGRESWRCPRRGRALPHASMSGRGEPAPGAELVHCSAILSMCSVFVKCRCMRRCFLAPACRSARWHRTGRCEPSRSLRGHSGRAAQLGVARLRRSCAFANLRRRGGEDGPSPCRESGCVTTVSQGHPWHRGGTGIAACPPRDAREGTADRTSSCADDGGVRHSRAYGHPPPGGSPETGAEPVGARLSSRCCCATARGDGAGSR